MINNMASPLSFAKIVGLVVFCFLSSVALGEEGAKYVERDVAFGNAIKLKDFGGPRIDVIVTQREMTFVAGTSADFTKLVPVARTNSQGSLASSRVVMVPTRTNFHADKKAGVTFPGSRSEMYLLYKEPTSGIRVYFLDAISKQNHDRLVISVPQH